MYEFLTNIKKLTLGDQIPQYGLILSSPNTMALCTQFCQWNEPLSKNNAILGILDHPTFVLAGRSNAIQMFV